MNEVKSDDGDCNWKKIKNDMKDHEKTLDDLVFTNSNIPEELLSRNVFGRRESSRIVEEVSLSEIIRSCKEAAAVSRELKSLPQSNRNSTTSDEIEYENLNDNLPNRSHLENRVSLDSVSSTSSLVKTATLKATLTNLKSKSYSETSETITKTSKERRSGAMLKWQKHVQTVSAFLAIKNNEKSRRRCESDKYNHKTKKVQKSDDLGNRFIRSVSVEDHQSCFPRTPKYVRGKSKIKKGFSSENPGFIVSSSNILSQPAEFFRSTYQGKDEAKEENIKGPTLSLNYELKYKNKNSFYANKESKENIFQRFNKQKFYSYNKDEKVSKKTTKLLKKKDRLKHSSAPNTFKRDDDKNDRKWCKEGGYVWVNMSGKQVELVSTQLFKLSELECEALKRIAVTNFNEMLLGINVVLPKNEYNSEKQKNSIKSKYLQLLTKDKRKDKEHVFGIPLTQVVENDQLLRLQKSESFAQTMSKLNGESFLTTSDNSIFNEKDTNSITSVEESASIYHECKKLENEKSSEYPTRASSLPHTPRPSRSSCMTSQSFDKSDGVTPQSPPATLQLPARPLRRRGAIGAECTPAIDPNQSQLLQALSLSVSSSNHGQQKKASLLTPTMSQVPYVVQKCCDYITKYGLEIQGIFRVAGSKKRVKQLREEFDQGIDVTIAETYNPHDVAALLKEFFRDLPEALLTKDLYPAFVKTASAVDCEMRMSAVRYLLWLLPVPNRDSLYTLLQFLSSVSQHSEEKQNLDGTIVVGNKMSVTNLATIFGPNLLHNHKNLANNNGVADITNRKGSDGMEDASNVIKVIQHMIINHVTLFQVPKQNHDQLLSKLKETDPEAVDFILRRKAASQLNSPTSSVSTELEEAILASVEKTLNSNAADNELENDSSFCLQKEEEILKKIVITNESSQKHENDRKCDKQRKLRRPGRQHDRSNNNFNSNSNNSKTQSKTGRPEVIKWPCVDDTTASLLAKVKYDCELQFFKDRLSSISQKHRGMYKVTGQEANKEINKHKQIRSYPETEV